MQPWVSTLLIVSLSALYLLICKFVADHSARWFRMQFVRIFGMRDPEWEYIDDEPVGLAYPLRWYEQLTWPIWLIPIVVMRIAGIPKQTSPTRDA